jgi:phosphoenolpyruvate synthase/pyruvate phosphate dikinase
MKDNSPINIIRWFEDLGSEDVPVVGGASLEEMIRTQKRQNIRVPDGFATTEPIICHLLSSLRRKGVKPSWLNLKKL